MYSDLKSHFLSTPFGLLTFQTVRILVFASLTYLAAVYRVQLW